MIFFPISWVEPRVDPWTKNRQAISAKTKLARQQAEAKKQETELAQESMVCPGLGSWQIEPGSPWPPSLINGVYGEPYLNGFYSMVS